MGRRSELPEKLIGKKFAKLTVLKQVFNESLTRKRSRFLCKCDCGKEGVFDGSKLNIGAVKSCGCIQKGVAKPSLRKSSGEALKNKIMGNYKGNAIKKGLDFKLNNEEMLVLFTGDCFYCGAKPTPRIHKDCFGEFICNGIDRLINNLGYIKKNCVSCCTRCNYLKNSYDLKEFLEIVRKIYYQTINI